MAIVPREPCRNLKHRRNSRNSCLSRRARILGGNSDAQGLRKIHGASYLRSPPPAPFLAPPLPVTFEARARILVVEDDEKLGLQVQEHLVEAGYEVDWVQHGDQALSLDPHGYNLVVLDLMLPGSYGLDILKRFRDDGCDVPVLVLSAVDDASIKVHALDLGADDYLTKPFWPEELVARVKARLRRPLANSEGHIELEGLRLDATARRAFVADVALDLTRAEFDLLLALGRRPGQALERSWLAEHVLDPEKEGTGRTLDAHVSRLRKKLGEKAGCIQTVWGVGYRLDISS